MKQFSKQADGWSPKVWDIFYSEYFKSEGIVVKFVSDTEWYFRLKGKSEVLRAQAKPSELTWYINTVDLQMIEVVKCRDCKKEEYYGMLHWHDGHTTCRRCIYEIWSKSSGYKWRPREEDYTFPFYSDGFDYRIEQ